MHRWGQDYRDDGFGEEERGDGDRFFQGSLPPPFPCSETAIWGNAPPRMASPSSCHPAARNHSWERIFVRGRRLFLAGMRAPVASCNRAPRHTHVEGGRMEEGRRQNGSKDAGRERIESAPRKRGSETRGRSGGKTVGAGPFCVPTCWQVLLCAAAGPVVASLGAVWRLLGGGTVVWRPPAVDSIRE